MERPEQKSNLDVLKAEFDSATKRLDELDAEIKSESFKELSQIDRDMTIMHRASIGAYASAVGIRIGLITGKNAQTKAEELDEKSREAPLAQKAVELAEGIARGKYPWLFDDMATILVDDPERETKVLVEFTTVSRTLRFAHATGDENGTVEFRRVGYSARGSRKRFIQLSLDVLKNGDSYDVANDTFSILSEDGETYNKTSEPIVVDKE
jgi:tetrahydromethanopterin S-methyltransferase subunit G